MYKLICIDLDGTLLNSELQVSELNKKAICDAIDQGIEVAIVSGRPNCFTIRIMNQISEKMGHITFNGAYYRIADKTKTFPIEMNAVKRLAKIAMDTKATAYFKNKNLSLCTQGFKGLLNYDSFKHEIPKKDQMDMRYHVDVVKYFEENEMDVIKILFVDDDLHDEFEAATKLIREDESNMHVFQYPGFMEMENIETSKGQAILNVCKELGCDASQVVAIGDNYNDVSMLEIAGLSVAMENSPESIKEMCHKVTKNNNEDGVAHAIYSYVLNK